MRRLIYFSLAFIIVLNRKSVKKFVSSQVRGIIDNVLIAAMDEVSIGVGDISRVYLADALENQANLYSAIRIGIIPIISPNIVASLCKEAATEASMVMLSKDYWKTANELAEFIEHVELSSRLDFNHYFIEHMDFPRENIW